MMSKSACLRGDVDAGCRMAEHEHARVGGQGSAHHRLLLVAAGKLAGILPGIADLDLQPGDHRVRQLTPPRRRRRNRPAAQPMQHRQRDVLLDRKIAAEACRVPIVRHVARRRPRVPDRPRPARSGLPLTDMRPAAGVRAVRRSPAASSDLPDPARPASPTRSPARTRIDTSCTAPVDRNGVDVEHDRAGAGLSNVGSRLPLARRAPGDRALCGLARERRPTIAATSSSSAEVADRRLGDQPAVAHDRHPLADLVDLLQMVGDEEERDAGALQPGDVIEELPDLARLELVPSARRG